MLGHGNGRKARRVHAVGGLFFARSDSDINSDGSRPCLSATARVRAAMIDVASTAATAAAVAVMNRQFEALIVCR